MAKYTDAQYAEIDNLVEQGASWREAGDTVGVPWRTAYMRKKRTSDPKPGGNRPKPKVSKPKATDEQLVSMCTKVAVAPSIYTGLILHCDFCTSHFISTGPDAATKFIEMSHDSPTLRGMLEFVHGYYTEAAWAGIIATWLGVPLLHHLAPDSIYRWLQVVLAMPPRGVAPPPGEHVHTNGHGPAEPAPTPFAGMDMDALLRMADGMGIRFEGGAPAFTANDVVADADVVTDAPVEPPDEAIDRAIDSLTADDTTATEADDTGTTETLASDSDAG